MGNAAAQRLIFSHTHNSQAVSVLSMTFRDDLTAWLVPFFFGQWAIKVPQ
jgi:hypothetical protein